MKMFRVLWLLSLSLLLTGCSPVSLTDKQIAKKYFRQARITYDEQGRVRGIMCPHPGSFIHKLLMIDTRCHIDGPLPPEIGQLTELKFLWLSASITELPPEIGNLTKLEKLRLVSNQLTSLPPEIGQLTHLTELELSSNNLTTLPPEIGQLRNLKSLDLKLNDLTSLPPEIGQLTHLTKLNLSNNNLTTLPPEVGQLTNIKKLNVFDNPISPSSCNRIMDGIDEVQAFLECLEGH